MIPLPNDIEKKDVSQWLDGGWFYAKVPDNDEPVMCTMLHVSGDDKLADVRTPDSKIYTVKWKEMFAHWPACGAINVLPHSDYGTDGKFAVSLIRLQKKQWKRTYNSSCVKLRPISDKAEHFGLPADSTAIAVSAFNPTYFTYTEAVKELFKDGWTSVAINPNLIVFKVPTHQLVFVDGEVVGMIDGKVFVCASPGLKRRLLPHFDYLVE